MHFVQMMSLLNPAFCARSGSNSKLSHQKHLGGRHRASSVVLETP